MNIIHMPVDQLKSTKWNANEMDASTTERLERSIKIFGPVQPLVVRETADSRYEVIGDNQRLKVLREAGVDTVPCVVVEVDDARAKLLSQALNHIHGEDDLGLKAELVRDILKQTSLDEVLSLLPETRESLKGLSSLGQIDMAGHLQA